MLLGKQEHFVEKKGSQSQLLDKKEDLNSRLPRVN
jgi:hypothetical protein